MNDNALSLGKLPARLLERLLADAPVEDPSVIVGPGIGMDCAVVEAGDVLLVLKSDPITFVSSDMGRYLVQVNGNDVATTGARPRWFLLTLLLAEHGTTEASVRTLMQDVYSACRGQGISVIGGHTEITFGLERPLAIGTLIGTVERENLVTPRGARPADRLLVTKMVPIEGTSILAREFPEQLHAVLSEAELREAQDFLFEPGISVVRDAQVALQAGTVTAMHDPTEGGLLAALWELAQASGRSLHADLARVPVADLSAKICNAFGIDPLMTIASGSLLLTAPAEDALGIGEALEATGIPCIDIGEVRDGPAAVYAQIGGRESLIPWPERDGVAQVFDKQG